MDKIQDSIYAFRKAQKLTQDAFCEKVGMSRVTLSGIERGGATTDDTINKICSAFDITKEELSKYGDKKKVQTNDNPWKDALVIQLKSQIESQNDTIQFLKSLIPRPAGQANFLKASHVDRSYKYVNNGGYKLRVAA